MSGAGADPRMAGLSADAVARLHAAARAIRDGDAAGAERLLGDVLAASPGHPEALRLSGILHDRRGHHERARELLSRALAQRPDDALVLSDLGSAQQGCGDAEAAFASWRRATEIAPGEPMPWFNLGRHLQLEGRTAEAADALERATALAADFLPARLLLADALVHLGRFEQADAHYRQALRRNPACGDAWRGLANMKTRPLSDEDAEQLALNRDRHDVAAGDRIAMGHALGKVREDQGRHAEAFAALAAANAELRRLAPWDAAGFSGFVDAVIGATAGLPAPRQPDLGSEAILVVGMPRSGSTLFEQILAAHPQVEGAGELLDLGLVIAGESARRGQPFPRWLPQADADDWHRLGGEYLRRTARWRTRRPRFTDKLPENWLYAGALRAMLPGAVVVETRRDPLETAWSCFKQQFYALPHFSCGFADIAAYQHDCARAMAAWRGRDPAHVALASYEALLADPEAAVRALLAACGLSFDPACLEFHRLERSVRTPSAGQVRQPLRHDTARAQRYGALLDPLREALRNAGVFGIPPS